MTPTTIPGTDPSDTVAIDVFGAARWFDSLWNSSACSIAWESRRRFCARCIAPSCRWPSR